MMPKQGAGSREQGAGSREQGAGSREQGAGSGAEAQCNLYLTRQQRFALGMELLRIRSRHGLSLTHEEIAAWAGCSKSTIWRIERRAIAKAKSALAERGFSFPIDCLK